MAEFMFLLPTVLVPCGGLALLMWLDHLEETLDQAVQRRSARAAAAQTHSERSVVVPGPVSTGQRPCRNAHPLRAKRPARLEPQSWPAADAGVCAACRPGRARDRAMGVTALRSLAIWPVTARHVRERRGRESRVEEASLCGWRGCRTGCTDARGSSSLMSNGLEMDTRFRKTRLRAGYSTEEVDAFIAELEIALFSPEPRVSASDVARQRFTEVRRFGYDMQDVDTCLEKAEHLLSEAEDRRDPHPFRRDLAGR